MPELLLNNEVLPLIKFLTDNDQKLKLMAKIKVTQIKSGIGSTKRQKRTLEALGIHKLNNTIEVDDSPQVQGMITKVRHLLRVE